jgi:transposase-like protein
MTVKRKRAGRPKAALVLTAGEKEALERYARGRTVSHALATRSRMVLMCAEGVENAAVAVVMGVTQQTVGRWRKRFIAHRLDGLADAPRPNVHRKLADERVEARSDGGRSRSVSRRDPSRCLV